MRRAIMASTPIKHVISWVMSAFVLYFIAGYFENRMVHLPLPKRLKMQYSEWPAFTSKTQYSSEWYRTHCFTKDFDNVEEIFNTMIPQWSLSKLDGCKETYRQFDLLYEVHTRFSKELTFPESFKDRVKLWLGNNPILLKKVHNQQLIFVYHPLTSEHVLYNTLRASRPMPGSSINLHEWVDKQSEESKKTCDFCKPLNSTAMDDLGRNTKQYTVRMSNTFKLDRWHAMVIPYKQHHPLNFTLPTFLAFFHECWMIAEEVQEMDNDYIYPNLVWDSLYQAGVSQFHPHIHIMMTPDHYYGFLEHLRSSGQQYFEAEGRNYFSTLMEVHEALGLTIHYGNSVAFPTLVGKSDMEVMFLSEAPGDDFYRLIFYTIKAYHDTFTQLCKGFVAAYPAVGDSERAKLGRIPVVARLISRGDCVSPRVDYSSCEIFQQTYRNHDPWQVARAIRKAVKKYDNE
ncbi:uncharacterized protein [Palaemon carinicauda]|uniref:uncharacterized protein n=1 Tax=Palaemon carinicauda TaxID=392227 RepID=UPI0035B6229A